MHGYDAAALPMAGITALRTLRSRSILGRWVLTTGAAGDLILDTAVWSIAIR
ncbi:hypothetical protein AB0O34_30115 [Sphaerisporangium sp. NPDC088356]|uniref:hypothetical protein n=1 Tax=Sphaerisporangium sp. NPDC088356 TaxID=3154871 RepID=UPI00343E430E